MNSEVGNIRLHSQNQDKRDTGNYRDGGAGERDIAGGVIAGSKGDTCSPIFNDGRLFCRVSKEGLVKFLYQRGDQIVIASINKEEFFALLRPYERVETAEGNE